MMVCTCLQVGRLLIENGADITMRTDDDRTPLHGSSSLVFVSNVGSAPKATGSRERHIC